MYDELVSTMAEDSDVNSGDVNENQAIPNNMEQNGTEDMPDFSDPEDFVDNISDEG